jgi:hypothetical protein
MVNVFSAKVAFGSRYQPEQTRAIISDAPPSQGEMGTGSADPTAFIRVNLRPQNRF